MFEGFLKAGEVWWHNHEILGALILAVVFAVVVDVLQPRTVLGKSVNLLRNKLAERSISKLNERIEKLSKRKSQMELYISSDRAMYLRVFRHLMVAVLFIASGGFVFIVAVAMVMEDGVPFHLPRIVQIIEQILFQLAVMAAWTGLKIAMLDTKEKLEKAAGDLDEQILGLRVKLGKKFGGNSKPQAKGTSVAT